MLLLFPSLAMWLVLGSGCQILFRFIALGLMWKWAALTVRWNEWPSNHLVHCRRLPTPVWRPGIGDYWTSTPTTNSAGQYQVVETLSAGKIMLLFWNVGTDQFLCWHEETPTSQNIQEFDIQLGVYTFSNFKSQCIARQKHLLNKKVNIFWSICPALYVHS